MNGCRSLGNHLYVDVDQQTKDMLLALRAGHQVSSLKAMNPAAAAAGGRGGGEGGCVLLYYCVLQLRGGGLENDQNAK